MMDLSAKSRGSQLWIGPRRQLLALAGLIPKAPAGMGRMGCYGHFTYFFFLRIPFICGWRCGICINIWGMPWFLLDTFIHLYPHSDSSINMQVSIAMRVPPSHPFFYGIFYYKPWNKATITWGTPMAMVYPPSIPYEVSPALWDDFPHSRKLPTGLAPVRKRHEPRRDHMCIYIYT